MESSEQRSLDFNKVEGVGAVLRREDHFFFRFSPKVRGVDFHSSCVGSMSLDNVVYASREHWFCNAE